ncbi:patatin-like phospholipase family protein [Anaeromicropila populeti]|uniref:Patatin-like phospholipase n=1 Tax=Anaeromicropila populeti TaxID=37658 RepID=A0A1I6KPX5_9FIRM|nr:patatin-like phospholipase family protein [Anaeromicropila populeti]SFR93299.1 Patatin-like phospholipase [Anaeromicropila populeti]
MSVSILSIDGGGMKGIISAIVLNKFEELLQQHSHRPDARIADYFDLVAGTSVGSILTTLLLYPENGRPKYSVKEALDLLLTKSNEIFVKQPFYPLFGAKYSTQCYGNLLNDFFHEDTLDSLLKQCIITAYDTTDRKAVFFNSKNAKADPNRNPFIKEVVLASSAAPTFFPPVCLKSTPACEHSYIDGGVVANNPSMCALIEALKLDCCNGLQDVYLFSVGNVEKDSAYTYKEVKKWGVLEWALPMLHILMDSSEQTAHYQLQIFFNNFNMTSNYLRTSVYATNKVPSMDDNSEKAIAYFIKAGNELVERELVNLDKFARTLIKNKEQVSLPV